MVDLGDIAVKKLDSYFDEDKNAYIVYMPHHGFFDRLAQKFFSKPKVSRIRLDGIGSDVWGLVDGKRTIKDIGEEIEKIYGDKAEPTYERLLSFMVTMEDNGFIEFKEASNISESR